MAIDAQGGEARGMEPRWMLHFPLGRGPRCRAAPGGGRGSHRTWAQPTHGCRSRWCRGSALALPKPKHEAESKESVGTRWRWTQPTSDRRDQSLRITDTHSVPSCRARPSTSTHRSPQPRSASCRGVGIAAPSASQLKYKASLARPRHAQDKLPKPGTTGHLPWGLWGPDACGTSVAGLAWPCPGPESGEAARLI